MAPRSRSKSAAPSRPTSISITVARGDKGVVSGTLFAGLVVVCVTVLLFLLLSSILQGASAPTYRYYHYGGVFGGESWVDEALGIFVLLLLARWSWFRNIQMQVALHLVLLVLLVHFHVRYQPPPPFFCDDDAPRHGSKRPRTCGPVCRTTHPLTLQPSHPHTLLLRPRPIVATPPFLFF